MKMKVSIIGLDFTSHMDFTSIRDFMSIRDFTSNMLLQRV